MDIVVEADPAGLVKINDVDKPLNYSHVSVNVHLEQTNFHELLVG